MEDFTVIDGGKILQMKFGPDDKLYVLASFGKTTKLFAIESTKPSSVAGTLTSNRKVTSGWPLYSLMTLLATSGFYVFKQLKHPHTPANSSMG